ncbi:hypothetical protein ACJ41O_001306 [Fusarium nematophilum]
MAQDHVLDSPGNALYPDIPPMRTPSLAFVYRLVAKMHPTNGYDIDNIQGTGVSRSIGHIQSGTVRGPEIEGIVVEDSGADWAERIHSKKVRVFVPSLYSTNNHQIYYKLDARYAIKTSDGHHIFVQARGLFRPGPGVEFDFEDSVDASYSQDQVEYFTHITFEAAGDGPYNWMNGIVAIGALQSFEGAAVIDLGRAVAANLPQTRLIADFLPEIPYAFGREERLLKSCAGLNNQDRHGKQMSAF